MLGFFTSQEAVPDQPLACLVRDKSQLQASYLVVALVSTLICMRTVCVHARRALDDPDCPLIPPPTGNLRNEGTPHQCKACCLRLCLS